MSIEKKFDIPFIAGLALREKQIQQFCSSVGCAVRTIPQTTATLESCPLWPQRIR
jgi:hypothetical protein